MAPPGDSLPDPLGLPDGAESTEEVVVDEAVKRLTSQGATREERLSAATAIGDACRTPQGRRAAAALGAAPLLVSMVRKGSISCKVAAARALWALAKEPEGQQAVDGAGGIAVLSLLAKQVDEECRLAASRALERAVSSPSAAASALRMSVAHRLAASLGLDASVPLRVAAARALSSLAANLGPGDAAALPTQEATEVLGALVSSLRGWREGDDEAFAETVAEALGGFAAADEGLRKEATSAGALSACVGLLGAPLCVSEGSVRALCALVAGDVEQREAVALGACGKLTGMLSKGGAGAAAAGVLRNLMMVREGREAAIACGAVQPLVRMAGRRGQGEEERAAAVGALANLCGSEAGREALVEAGGLRELVAAAGEADPRFAIAAEEGARGLRNLAASRLEQVASAGAVGVLLRLVSRGSPKARELAVSALYPFANDEKQVMALLGGSFEIPVAIGQQAKSRARGTI